MLSKLWMMLVGIGLALVITVVGVAAFGWRIERAPVKDADGPAPQRPCQADAPAHPPSRSPLCAAGHLAVGP